MQWSGVEWNAVEWSEREVEWSGMEGTGIEATILYHFVFVSLPAFFLPYILTCLCAYCLLARSLAQTHSHTTI